jgi:hypothetical protein
LRGNDLQGDEECERPHDGPPPIRTLGLASP